MTILLPGPVARIPIATIDDSGPRLRRDRYHDDAARSLGDLVGSVATWGLIHPLVVRPEGHRHVLIAGWRRLEAARRAGLESVPAVCCDVPPGNAWIVQLEENGHRHDLSPADEAQAYWDVHVLRGVAVPLLARLVHRDQRYVAKRIAAARSAHLMRALAEGRISIDTAHLLHVLGSWFAEPGPGEVGAVRYAMCHEPAALFRRLEGGGRVALAEARDLLAHYERWGVPRDAAGYDAMIRADDRLQLPYARYVHPAYYAARLAALEAARAERHEADEGRHRAACERRGEEYRPAPPPGPVPPPSVATIAAFAPPPAGPPTADPSRILAGLGPAPGAEEPVEEILGRLVRPLDTATLVALEAIVLCCMVRAVAWPLLWRVVQSVHAARA